jgi:hypothetical protein
VSREPALVRVKVSDGTQVSVDGTTFPSGAEVQAPEAIAERWVVRGWAEPLEPRASKPTGDVGKAPTRSRRTR